MKCRGKPNSPHSITFSRYISYYIAESLTFGTVRRGVGLRSINTADLSHAESGFILPDVVPLSFFTTRLLSSLIKFADLNGHRVPGRPTDVPKTAIISPCRLHNVHAVWAQELMEEGMVGLGCAFCYTRLSCWLKAWDAQRSIKQHLKWC